MSSRPIRGRIASRLGIVYADIFTGAFPIDGVDWWQHLPVPGQPGKQFRGRFKRPADRQMLRRAMTQNRYVLMTGEHDGNRDQTQTFFASGYKGAGFRHAHYLEVSGKGHALPDAEWFEKGIDLLDAPLDKDREPEPAPSRGSSGPMSSAARWRSA